MKLLDNSGGWKFDKSNHRFDSLVYPVPIEDRSIVQCITLKLQIGTILTLNCRLMTDYETKNLNLINIIFLFF